MKFSLGFTLGLLTGTTFSVGVIAAFLGGAIVKTMIDNAEEPDLPEPSEQEATEPLPGFERVEGGIKHT